MTPATGNGHRGFTLVELCVAGAIIGLICSLCWPPLRAYSQALTVRASAGQFAERLRGARERAVSTGVTQRISAIVGPNIRSAGGEAVFFPDGSAGCFEITFNSNTGRNASIKVEETGRINVLF